MAVVGDKLSNDGEICDHRGMMFMLAGHQAALINGAAYCPVCKTTGYIAKEGGPRRMTVGASEIALENDVVVCGCPEYPRIFARLAGEAWYDDMAETHRAANGSVAMNSLLRLVFDEGYVLRDKSGGNPLANWSYRLISDSGSIVEGRTDAAGRTRRIETSEAQRITVEIEGAE